MSNSVRAKKHLGQHFLKDQNIAQKIVAALPDDTKAVLEVGPGMGILTKFLLQQKKLELKVIDIDLESIDFLKENFPELKGNIIAADFLKEDLTKHFADAFSVIGNFPYNISSQIIFKILDHRNQVPAAVGMFQKEVAERIAAGHNNKTYGILSVLTQAFYDVEYLFTVSENVFIPPPKVKSAVIRLKRKEEKLNCNETLFFKVIKAGFNQRRKTLRNALKSFTVREEFRDHEFFTKRAEALTVKQFEELTNMLDKA